MAISNARKSHNLRLAGLKAQIDRQAELVKRKREDITKFNKMAKTANKGKGLKAEMQSNLILNSKKQDHFRAKQRLDEMKLGYQNERKKKVL